jgi:hypothetical protein
MSANGYYKVAWIGFWGVILGSLINAMGPPLVTRILSELPTSKTASEPTPIPTNLKVVSTIRFVQVP